MTNLPGRNLYLVALGGNAHEDTESNVAILKDGIERLAGVGLQPLRVSRFWRTPAYPVGAGPDFANACLVAQGYLAPEAALAALHAVESGLGRQRRERWGQRVIDLDLLAVGQQILPDSGILSHWMGLSPDEQRTLAPEGLILPHPRLHERAFVLVPLAEVAPDWLHPVLGKTVVQMRDALDPAGIAAMQPM